MTRRSEETERLPAIVSHSETVAECGTGQPGQEGCGEDRSEPRHRRSLSRRWDSVVVPLRWTHTLTVRTESRERTAGFGSKPIDRRSQCQPQGATEQGTIGRCGVLRRSEFLANLRRAQSHQRKRSTGMDLTTILIIVLILILLGGGGWYGRGRWY